jgi:hypothetical protein
MRATCLAHLVLLDLIILVIFVENKKLGAPHCAIFSGLFITSSLLGPNIPLSTLFSDTLNQRYSLNVRDQISHPNETERNIIVLCILLFIFLDSRREDKRF